MGSLYIYIAADRKGCPLPHPAAPWILSMSVTNRSLILPGVQNLHRTPSLAYISAARMPPLLCRSMSSFSFLEMDSCRCSILWPLAQGMPEPYICDWHKPLLVYTRNAREAHADPLM